MFEYIIVFLISMIPFTEYLFSVPAAIIVFRLSPVVSTIVIIIGNILSVLIFVFLGDKIRQLYYKIRKQKEEKPRKEVNPKLRKYYERFGVPGLSTLGTFFVSSQLTAMAITTFESSRGKAVFWVNLSVIVFSIILAILSVFAEDWISSQLSL